jgi:folate-binding protein YgfZ
LTTPRLIDLSQRSLLCVSGADALSFLQGQLTQDISALAAPVALWAGYCSPKGRLLATFLVWREHDAYWLDAAGDLAEPMLKRLSQYVLRSKVTITLRTQPNRPNLGTEAQQVPIPISTLGLVGDAAAVLSAVGLTCPAVPQHSSTAGITVISLSAQRTLLVGPSVAMHALQERLTSHCTTGTALDWASAAVHEGVAEITLATQDEWIPQMLNWDVLGGINFKKGCYTGQEIVARSHYLGQVKRRLYRLNVVGTVQVGDAVYGADPQSPVGKIAMVGNSSTEGCEVLAVLTRDATQGPLHLGSPAGAALQFLPLPYKLPTP